MSNKLQLRRDTAANWEAANPVLAQGETGLILDDNGKVVGQKIGDGVTEWKELEKVPFGQAEINKIKAALNTRGFLSVTGYQGYAMLNVDIKKNQRFKLKISSELKQWSRLLICANLENSNRLLDTENDFFEDGEWMDFLAPYDITWLGLYVVSSTEEQFTMTCEFHPTSAKDIENEIRDKYSIKTIKTSANILNPYRAEIGYIDSNGSIVPYYGFYTSEYIFIKKGQSLYVSQLRKFAFYDINKVIENLVVDTDVNNYIYTADADGWVRISFRTDAYKMVAYSSEYLPYEPYRAEMEDGVSLSETQKSEICDIIAYQTGGGVTLIKDGEQLLFISQGNKLRCAIDNDYANGLFNFVETTYANDVIGQGDDIAPIHAIGTTIGANHAHPCYRASVVNHGKTNDNIGETWVNAKGEIFYLVGIVDGNLLRFIGENLSEVLTEGELINGNQSLTITSVTSTQMYKAVKNVSHKILNNGVQEITSNGTYTSKYFDVVEYYDIMLTSSTLEKLKNGSHILDGDTFVRIVNTYRIMENCNTLIFATLIPLMPFQFSDAMYAQAIRQGENGQVSYYLPNSKPSVYDFTKPLQMYWGNDVSGININQHYWKDDENPVNRVIQIADNHGFAIGFIPTGVGKELNKYTKNSFELRNNTGKVYPHGVESSKVGDTLQVGQIYSAGMYRCYFPLENLGKKIAFYHYDLNGVEYVYADFSNSGIETINIGPDFNGRNVEVVESSNVTLISNLYNNGVMVNVDYLNEDTSYIVFKLVV